MELIRSFGPRRKKLVLSTERKMNVLSILNSDTRNCLNDKDSKSDHLNIYKHGKEVMSFIQSEQFHVECLNCLKNCLSHPLLKKSIEALDDITGLVDEMLAIHSNLCSALICGKSDMSLVLSKLSASLDTHISYSVFIGLEMKNFQKFFESYDNVYIDFDLLQEPMVHISRYKSLFQNLYNAMPEEAYCNILKAVEVASENIENAFSLRYNALRILQIQRFLFKREPKLLCPGRTVLKEGILCKVDPKGNGLKERVFFLFNDIFLCCKIISKAPDWHEKDSLQFRSLFPLNMCVVKLVMGSEKQGTLFQVLCGTMSYLLISKIPGEAQSWFHELQAAIRTYPELKAELKPKLNLRRNTYLKRRISPFLRQPFRSIENDFDSQKNTKNPPQETSLEHGRLDKKYIEEETMIEPQLYRKKSSHKIFFNLLACVNI